MRDTLAPVLNKRDVVAAYLVKASDPNISKQFKVEVDRDSVDASTTSTAVDHNKLCGVRYFLAKGPLNGLVPITDVQIQDFTHQSYD